MSAETPESEVTAKADPLDTARARTVAELVSLGVVPVGVAASAIAHSFFLDIEAF